jgi:NADPH:quinone reductase
MLAAVAEAPGGPICVSSVAQPIVQAARLAEAGRIKPHLDPRRFTLDSVADAYEAIDARTARGKLVVDIPE